jgi:hypothetical protein
VESKKEREKRKRQWIIGRKAESKCLFFFKGKRTAVTWQFKWGMSQPGKLLPQSLRIITIVDWADVKIQALSWGPLRTNTGCNKSMQKFNSSLQGEFDFSGLKLPKSETIVSDIVKSPLLALIHVQKNPRKTRNIARARSLQIRSLL